MPERVSVAALWARPTARILGAFFMDQQWIKLVWSPANTHRDDDALVRRRCALVYVAPAF